MKWKTRILIGVTLVLFQLLEVCSALGKKDPPPPPPPPTKPPTSPSTNSTEPTTIETISIAEPPSEETKKDSNSFLVIAGVGGAVGLVLLAIYCIVMWAKNKSKEGDAAPLAGEGTPKPEEPKTVTRGTSRETTTTPTKSTRPLTFYDIDHKSLNISHSSDIVKSTKKKLALSPALANVAVDFKPLPFKGGNKISISAVLGPSAARKVRTHKNRKKNF